MSRGILDLLAVERVVPVIRARHIADVAGLAATLEAAGAAAVEITLTTAGALEAIEVASGSGALVGAGTVLSADDARRSVAAGARFLVTPCPVSEVADVAHDERVPVILGALTPGEVLHAVQLGAVAVKIFPAGVHGARYLSDLRGPFPDVALVPSGGIDVVNARSFVDAGALAVCAGSATIPADLVEQGELTAIGQRMRDLVRALADDEGAMR